MKLNRVPIILILGLMTMGLLGCTGSRDFPQWRGLQRDGKVTGFETPASWPTQMKLIWQQEVGEADASPAYAGGKFYLLVKQDSSEVLLCLDGENGNMHWKSIINAAPEITGGARTHPGPRSTPTVTKGKVFTLGASGVVACHDAKEGKMIWINDSYTTEVPRFFTSASPLVVENACILHLGGNENGVIVAFDVQTGKEIWSLAGEPCTYSSAMTMQMEEKIIVIQSETDLLGISLTGKLLWKIPTPNERMYYGSATPVIEGNHLFITGHGFGSQAYRITQTGEIYAFEEIWNNPDFGTTFNTPVWKDGYLYGNDARLGNIFCLDAETGETAWSDTVKLNRFASMLDLGEVMMTLSSTGPLIFFEATSGGYAELAKYKIADTDVYAHPLPIGDKIYIKDEKHLTCWAFEN